MGGEWTTGAALIAETWPAEHRGKALGLMQSTWAIGEIVAAGVVARRAAALRLARGLLRRRPARAARASGSGATCRSRAIWLQRGAARGPGSLRLLWRPDLRRNGLLATAMNACAMFGYWGLFTWIPAYLVAARRGGRPRPRPHEDHDLAGRHGRRQVARATPSSASPPTPSAGGASYVAYLLVAAALVPLYGLARRPAVAARARARSSPSSAPASSPASARSPPSSSRPRSAPPPWA